ncbi:MULTISPECIES: hypothetical protein [unclassified Pseudomonas]|uniref:hypothetical protein n=1 Tax=unclassified Pseudomonas TaxID=196821 RepID=UPI000C877459|nr:MULTISPECIES: hypothetical protein [unclassified Pseudomonas]PMU08282.1 hypothetical protein C1Y11_23135 [Pseudomonas sp. FW305-20]PMU18307.1 hypothetical protein C1Y10_13345 [Pseudomonas sp. FW305-122]PMU39642.1 hypothetical protein C1Y12_13150 [Pseudomonas sp. FW305-47B]PMX61030.1 hypothetical protein C1Y13_12615 [Pseudomonas sp. FW305-33]PMX66175.1 hypothetical protein C1X12_17935 [Pseudomonas sp. FW305-60]
MTVDSLLCGVRIGVVIFQFVYRAGQRHVRRFQTPSHGLAAVLSETQYLRYDGSFFIAGTGTGQQEKAWLLENFRA